VVIAVAVEVVVVVIAVAVEVVVVVIAVAVEVVVVVIIIRIIIIYPSNFVPLSLPAYATYEDGTVFGNVGI